MRSTVPFRNYYKLHFSSQLLSQVTILVYNSLSAALSVFISFKTGCHCPPGRKYIQIRCAIEMGINHTCNTTQRSFRTLQAGLSNLCIVLIIDFCGLLFLILIKQLPLILIARTHTHTHAHNSVPNVIRSTQPSLCVSRHAHSLKHTLVQTLPPVDVQPPLPRYLPALPSQEIAGFFSVLTPSLFGERLERRRPTS